MKRIAKYKGCWVPGTGPLYELKITGRNKPISIHYDIDTAKKNAKYYLNKTGRKVWIYKYIGYYGKAHK